MAVENSESFPGPASETSTTTSHSERNSSIITRSIQDFLQTGLQFKKKRIHHEQNVRTFLPRHLLRAEHSQACHTTEEKLQQIRKHHKHYAKNKIRTTKYTVLSFVPKNLFEQFHRFANCYFVFIILLNFIPQVGAIQPYLSMVPVIGILLVQAIKDLVEDYGRYVSDSEVNNNQTEMNLSSDNKYHTVKWSELQVGDIVRVVCNSVIPADLLLLHTSDVDGKCFIETSNIDGESNLKQRNVIQRHWGHHNPNEFHPTDFKSIIECQTPNNEIYKFHGNIIPPDNGDKISINNNNLLLRGCVIRNTDYVEGIVIYAGHETKAMLNNNGPRHKRSKLERRMNTDVVYCVILLVIMCLIGAVGNAVWAVNQNSIEQTELYLPRDENGNVLNPALSGFYMFWTMVILLQVLIPISLYVSIELVKSAQVYMINHDCDLYHEETDTPMKCRALNITEDLGQIQYIFSDKTGTLTENQMVFRRCTVGGVDYPHAANAARIENLEAVPADLNPALHLKFSDKDHMMSKDETTRQSYRRPKSGSVKPHHSASRVDDVTKDETVRNHSTVSKQQADVMMEEEKVGHMTTRSAPNSPGISRRKTTIKRPAAHHRRNISSVSAKEVKATIAHEPDEPEEPIEPDDLQPVNEDLETDVTPDPVLFSELQSIEHRGGGDDPKVKMSVKKERILDFFINLAICNTVVLSTDQEEANQQLLTSPSGDRYTNTSSGESSPKLMRRDLGEPLLHKSVHFMNGNNSANLHSPGEGYSKRFTTEELSKIRYEAESPDEAALVYAAHAYGCVLAHRSAHGGNETVTITLPNGEGSLEFQVLHKLPFDSNRKRMSVVVRDPHTGVITLYCKGADSSILNQLAEPLPDVEFDLEYNKYQDVSFKHSNSFDVVASTKKFLDAYARTGLRTLCISKRVLSNEEYTEWLSEYREADRSFENRDHLIMQSFCKMETQLELLGATGIEDRLQDGVPETIESLRQAGIQVWVLTGDKQETAINIGYSCRLIHQRDEVIKLNAENKESLLELLNDHIKDQDRKRGKQPDYDQQNSILNSFNISFVLPNSTTYPDINDKDMPALVLVIDGKTLAFALQKDVQKDFVKLARRCRSVLCCRATPLQKGEVVKLIREELNVMTLAIGDGANDVSMIQVADVGIGLSGQEGMQAVMSSDYALAQFRFLRKLLLVHGHWNYARLAPMVLYFFYKNAAYVLLIFWFQLLCGFSGGNMIEQWYLLLFNLIFTSVPPLISGVLDKDLQEETLLRKPSLYGQGIKDELYLQRSFWVNMLDATYQSLVMFYFSYFAYFDSEVGLIEWGTVVTSAALFIILIHLAIETKTWTWIHWVSQIASILVFFAFALIYNIVCPACSPPSNPYFVMERLIVTGKFWFTILLVTVVSLFPRYVIRALQSSIFPTECQRERILEQTQSHRSSLSTLTTFMASSSTTSSSSTYQNPTFHPPPPVFTNEYPKVNPHQLPEASKNFDLNFSGREEIAKEAFSFQYGGSTPDLTTTSPYYGAHNSNQSNNRNAGVRSIARGATANEPPLVANPLPSSLAFDNSAYHGLSDGSGCEQDSDTGECNNTPPQSEPSSNIRRPSVKRAYEEAFNIPSEVGEGAGGAHPPPELGGAAPILSESGEGAEGASSQQSTIKSENQQEVDTMTSLQPDVTVASSKVIQANDFEIISLTGDVPV